ncbi:MAG: 2,3,4,5-tetrahydropyridine-2,6-dicarboxylate N-succinyltransferase, partial [Alphaproteobacteria bacterium]|nr:2,3,4,5-tetrahydropyridine-2,6-dicarboxylate N-succinyltransferase [Alphaproteobacteria bacterium]
MNTLKPEELEILINEAWERRDTITPREDSRHRHAIIHALNDLDKGQRRVAEKIDGTWVTHQWLKKAILLSFRIHESIRMSGGPGGASWYDKIPSKFQHWSEDDFGKAGFRAVPNAVVRHSAYVAPGAILMPCFLNVGAYVGEGTLIDTWSTVGSCAQIGRNIHISGGVGIGGVLEPLQATPTIIEDDCFIGARSEVAEGVIVERGAVISMGVYLGASTKIIDRTTGEIFMGRVPAYSVVVPGTLPGKPL